MHRRSGGQKQGRDHMFSSSVGRVGVDYGLHIQCLGGAVGRSRVEITCSVLRWGGWEQTKDCIFNA